MGIAASHHILKLEIGAGKRKGRQIACCITNLGLPIDYLDSLVPKVTNGHVYHSLCITWGRVERFFFFIFNFFLLICMGGF